MKSLVLKSLFLISIVAFSAVLLMIIIGCTSCCFGVSESFFEGTYCTIGKVVLVIALVAILGILLFNYKVFLNKGDKDDTVV